MIGNNLKAARKKSELTQVQVARRLHISPKTVSSWENNRSAPDLDSLVKLGAVYQSSVDSLLETASNLAGAQDNGMQRCYERSTWAEAVALGLTLNKIGMITFKLFNVIVPSCINVLCNALLMVAVAWMLPAALAKIAAAGIKIRRLIITMTGALTSIGLTLQLSLLPFNQLIGSPDRVAFFTGFVLVVLELGCGIFISLTFFEDILDNARLFL